MNAKIYVHRYTLKSRLGLNSRSHALEHEGALLRVDKDGVSGYACLHPWEELGDLSLAELLKQLFEGRSSRQVNCALECADIDREARKAGVSLFENLKIPLSHATIVGGIEKVEQAVGLGFDSVKLKMGKDVESNILFLKSINEEFPELRIRIDFNGVSNLGDLDIMLCKIGDEACSQLDFIEDPLPRSDNRWSTIRDKYGVSIAIDRGCYQATGEFDVSVVKPAIDPIEGICNSAKLSGRSVVVTSYMDHPIGQRYAAYTAAKLSSQYVGLVNDRCGLVTHGLYRGEDFIERMGEVSPVLTIESNTSGLGFDDLLVKIDWEKLK